MTSSLLDRLSAACSTAFAAEGLDGAFGRVQRSDRPDLAPFQCNGALGAAKAARANPREIATRIAARLEADGLISGVEIAGPGFLNITPSDATLAETAETMANDPQAGAWRRPEGEREKIVLDYGGPNVAKPLHVGHLRSAIIGESLKRLFRLAGDEVLGDIHLGDWGLQMGQLITELEIERPDLPYFAEGEGPFPTESPVTVADLAALYPRASAASKTDPERRDAARRATAALQEGRPGYLALWRHFVEVSRAALERDYADLGVTFDLWKGEADAQGHIPALLNRLRERGLLEQSDGAEVVRVARDDDKKDMPPLIVLTSEGSVLYGSTDLATILERAEEMDADRIVYVVDQRQSQHFEQVFRAADLAGIMDKARLEHQGFGTMNGKDGKPFKTRDGGVLRLRDLIEEVTGVARERIAEGGMAEGQSEAEVRRIADIVGIAALKFADLSNPRTSDYVFEPQKFVTFEGKTGPYLLYAAVRIASVLNKAGSEGEGADFVLGTAEERGLVLALSAWPDAMRAAYERRMPHLICDHAYGIAQAFSRVYAACRIVDEADEGLRASRLRLAALTRRQLSGALDLLGIEVPARM